MLVRSGLAQFDPLSAVRFGVYSGVTKAENIAVGPSWCSWMPFAKLFSECYPTAPLTPPAPAVPAVSMTEAPASGEEAEAAAQAVSDRQVTDWRRSLQDFYGNLAANVGQNAPSPVTTWWDRYGNVVLLTGLGIGVIWAGKRI